MKNINVVFLLFMLVMLASTLFGQESLNNRPPEPEEMNSISLPLTTRSFYLSLSVLIFGLMIILMEMYLAQTKRIESENIIKVIIITLIITATLFLITAGYNNNQIAPAIGLLGTIAGYLLGKMNPKTDDK